MKGLFNLDSAPMRALGFLGDLMLLNGLFVICCIPVVTVGPALTAMNYVVLKMRIGEEGSIPQTFFRSFRQNFRQGLILGLVFMAAGLFFGFDLYLVWRNEFALAVRVVVTMMAVLYAMTLLYAFPLLAWFENSIRQTIRNAVVLSVVSLHRTVMMLLLVAACVMGTLYNEFTLKYGILVWILLGFSGVSYINSALLKKTFAKFEGE